MNIKLWFGIASVCTKVSNLQVISMKSVLVSKCGLLLIANAVKINIPRLLDDLFEESLVSTWKIIHKNDSL